MSRGGVRPFQFECLLVAARLCPSERPLSLSSVGPHYNRHGHLQGPGLSGSAHLPGSLSAADRPSRSQPYPPVRPGHGATAATPVHSARSAEPARSADSAARGDRGAPGGGSDVRVTPAGRRRRRAQHVSAGGTGGAGKGVKGEVRGCYRDRARAEGRLVWVVDRVTRG